MEGLPRNNCVGFARSAQPKKTSKRITAKARDRNTTATKVAATLRNNVAAETIRDKTPMIDAQFGRFRGSDTLRVLAERNLAQTRELYEGSKNRLVG
jgi:hypothetical protein